MFRDLARTISLISPVVFLIIISNYFIDPGALYGFGKSEETILKNLLERKDHSLTIEEKNFKPIPVLKAFLQKSNSSFDNLVIGSSRALPVNKEIDLSKSFFNASVSSCHFVNPLN